MAYYYLIPTAGCLLETDENIQQYPGNIWVTDNSSWVARTGAIEKTKEEAQIIVDSAISGLTFSNDHINESLRGQPLTISLP